MSTIDTTEPFPLFVYGTLRTGQPLEAWLKDVTLDVKPGIIKGRLYPSYNGHYPVAKLDQVGLIHGEVRLCKMEQMLFQCMNMERQAGYQMVTVPLCTIDGFELPEADGGKRVAAFHYPGRVPTAHPILSGDWVEWVNNVSIRWR